MKATISNPVLQESVTFIKTAAESGGAVSELELTLAPGGGNPLHYHTSYTEAFTAIDGELSLGLGGDRTVVLQPGHTYVVEIDQAHRFFNPPTSRYDFATRFAQAIRASRTHCGSCPG